MVSFSNFFFLVLLYYYYAENFITGERPFKEKRWLPLARRRCQSNGLCASSPLSGGAVAVERCDQREAEAFP